MIQSIFKAAHFDPVNLKKRNTGKSVILKVGSWSFEGITSLLIYFRNCRKALFTKNQQVSVKGIKLKVSDKPFYEGFPNSAAHTS